VEVFQLLAPTDLTARPRSIPTCEHSEAARQYAVATRTDSGARKTTMIVALARKLLIELWRVVTTGKVPEGVVLHAA
jgi:hypothetical protein